MKQCEEDERIQVALYMVAGGSYAQGTSDREEKEEVAERTAE